MHGFHESDLMQGIPCYPLVWVDGVFRADLSEYPNQISINTAAECSIIVAKNQRIDKPIYVYQIATGTKAHMHQTCAYQLEVGSQATVIEHWVGEASATHTREIATNIQLQAGSTLSYLQWQEESIGAQHVCNMTVEQCKDSTFFALTASLGAAHARLVLHTHLREAGASCTLNGIYMTREGQRHEIDTCMHHHADHTHSNEFYKGLAGGERAKSKIARASFSGLVEVAADLKKIKSHQLNHNLLLTETAEIHTRPELYIDCEDIECSHGATVGQLDEAALFYLQARGLSIEDARAALIFAFILEILNTWPEPVIRAALVKRLSPAGIECGNRIFTAGNADVLSECV